MDETTVSSSMGRQERNGSGSDSSGHAEADVDADTTGPCGCVPGRDHRTSDQSSLCGSFNCPLRIQLPSVSALQEQEMKEENALPQEYLIAPVHVSHGSLQALNRKLTELAMAKRLHVATMREIGRVSRKQFGNINSFWCRLCACASYATSKSRDKHEKQCFTNPLWTMKDEDMVVVQKDLVQGLKELHSALRTSARTLVTSIDVILKQIYGFTLFWCAHCIRGFANVKARGRHEKVHTVNESPFAGGMDLVSLRRDAKRHKPLPSTRSSGADASTGSGDGLQVLVAAIDTVVMCPSVPVRVSPIPNVVQGMTLSVMEQELNLYLAGECDC
jgi:hypothetical protein